MSKKNIICFLVTTVALCLLSFSASYGAKQTPGGTPIIVSPEDPDLPDAPRGPVYNPFTAYLLNNQVVLESSENCGLVTVEITSTTGFYFSTVFDTEDGFIVMPVSGNVGSYTLTLTMSSGDVFTGIFTI